MQVAAAPEQVRQVYEQAKGCFRGRNYNLPTLTKGMRVAVILIARVAGARSTRQSSLVARHTRLT